MLRTHSLEFFNGKGPHRARLNSFSQHSSSRTTGCCCCCQAGLEHQGWIANHDISEPSFERILKSSFIKFNLSAMILQNLSTEWDRPTPYTPENWALIPGEANPSRTRYLLDIYISFCCLFFCWHLTDIFFRRTQTGSLKWHRHKSRKITQILFRLRTGHNRLKAQMARLMPQENPNCLECEEPETTEHALLHCTALEMERFELTQYFREKNLNLNLPNVLGLNFELDHRTQFEIQHHLVRYIKNSRLINRI